MSTPAAPKKHRELSPLGWRFIAEWAKDQNVTAAARRAGCPESSAGSTGMKLMQHPTVKAYVDEVRAKMAAIVKEKVVVASERTLSAMAGMAYFDPIDFVNEDGSTKNINELPPHARLAVQGFKTAEVVVRGKKVVTTEYRLVNRVAAVDMAAKVTGEYKVDNQQRRNAREMSDEDLMLRIQTLAAGAGLAPAPAADAPPAEKPPTLQ